MLLMDANFLMSRANVTFLRRALVRRVNFLKPKTYFTYHQL